MDRSKNKREQILDIAERSVLSKGFDATSIEEIVVEANITKGGFFYHFRDKNALAIALLKRAVSVEHAVNREILARARSLTDDPLQIVLIGLKLLAEYLENDERPDQGSLLATIVYQERLFNREVIDVTRELLNENDAMRLSMLQDIADKYELSDDIQLEDLARLFNAVMEGSMVQEKAFGDKTSRARNALLYRSYLKLLFARQKEVRQ